jgi:alkylation response protein AidB-like acyl-CoA dehydrogenase
MNWDNTTLFTDDTDADCEFRAEVREWVTANCPASLRHRPDRIEPPELKPWHRKLAERGWIAPHWPVYPGSAFRCHDRTTRRRSDGALYDRLANRDAGINFCER